MSLRMAGVPAASNALSADETEAVLRASLDLAWRMMDACNAEAAHYRSVARTCELKYAEALRERDAALLQERYGLAAEARELVQRLGDAAPDGSVRRQGMAMVRAIHGRLEEPMRPGGAELAAVVMQDAAPAPSRMQVTAEHRSSPNRRAAPLRDRPRRTKAKGSRRAGTSARTKPRRSSGSNPRAAAKRSSSSRATKKKHVRLGRK